MTRLLGWLVAQRWTATVAWLDEHLEQADLDNDLEEEPVGPEDSPLPPCGAVHCQVGARTPPHTCVLPAGHADPFHRDYSGVEWLWWVPPKRFRVAS